MTQSHVTRTALRKVGQPVVQLVAMPPQEGSLTLMLLASCEPIGGREFWAPSLDFKTPLSWRNYQLCQGEKGNLTWRLKPDVRDGYLRLLTRQITGSGLPGARDYPEEFMPDDRAANLLRHLIGHLQRYPGFSGVRTDISWLRFRARKMWTSTRPGTPFPEWPTMPYLPYRQPRTAPFSQLINPSGGPHE